LNPGKAIDTEKIIDTGDESVRTLNPAKIIDTGQDADLTVNPGKVIVNRHCKIIDTILTLEKTQTLL
jgi:hypothetical protein